MMVPPDDIYCFEVRGWDQFFPGAENCLPGILSLASSKGPYPQGWPGWVGASHMLCHCPVPTVPEEGGASALPHSQVRVLRLREKKPSTPGHTTGSAGGPGISPSPLPSIFFPLFFPFSLAGGTCGLASPHLAHLQHMLTWPLSPFAADSSVALCSACRRGGGLPGSRLHFSL